MLKPSAAHASKPDGYALALDRSQSVDTPLSFSFPSLPWPGQAQLAKLVSMFFLQVHQKLMFVQLTLQCAATCGLDL